MTTHHEQRPDDSPPLTLVILAAGSSTRFGSPKQLVPVGPCGESLLEFTAFDAFRAGFQRLVLVIREETEDAFSQHLSNGVEEHMQVRFAHQRTERPRPWGTGHAVLAAGKCVNGPFAVANADDFYGREALQSVADLLRRSARPAQQRVPTYGVVALPVAATLSPTGGVNRALCSTYPTESRQVDLERPLLRELRELYNVRATDNGIVHDGRDHEDRLLPADAPVSMNLWALRPSIFEHLDRGFKEFRATVVAAADRDADSAKDDIPQLTTEQQVEFTLPDFISKLIQNHLVTVELLHAPGPWCGLTFAEDLPRTKAQLARLTEGGHYPRDLWANCG